MHEAENTVLEPVEDDVMIVALLGKIAEPPECQPPPKLRRPETRGNKNVNRKNECSGTRYIHRRRTENIYFFEGSLAIPSLSSGTGKPGAWWNRVSGLCIYVGHLESEERLRIRPAQLFNFS